MPSTLASARKQTQICQDMYSRLVKLQGDLRTKLGIKAPKELANKDGEIFEDSHMVEAELEKFFASIFNEMNMDAERIAGAAIDPNGADYKEVEESLDHMHQLFMTAHKVYRQQMRNAHFFYQFTAKLDKMIKSKIKGVKGLEKKHEDRLKQEMSKKKLAEQKLKRKLINEERLKKKRGK